MHGLLGFPQSVQISVGTEKPCENKTGARIKPSQE
jgi:hypothetical protein